MLFKYITMLWLSVSKSDQLITYLVTSNIHMFKASINNIYLNIDLTLRIMLLLQRYFSLNWQVFAVKVSRGLNSYILI